MDCNMPVMDGFQATLEIKKLCEIYNFEIHIVALTAYTTELFREKSMSSGMNEFINKPVNSDQIRHILSQQGIIPPLLSP